MQFNQNRTIAGTLFLWVFLLMSPVAFSQRIDLKHIRLNEPVPFDPAVRRGVLPNGLHYYLSRNTQKPGRAFMHLTIKAGSDQQDKDQSSETAHIVEHILFRNAPPFPEGSLKQYLLATGIDDWNGGTGHECTNYYFGISSESPFVEKFCDIFKYWLEGKACQLDSDIEAEKRIVCEEQGLNGYARDYCLKTKMLAPSRFSEHYIPVAQHKLVNLGVADSAVRRFYKDWYRPDMAAVMIVGDIDINQTEVMVKKVFNGIQKPAHGRPHEFFPVRGSGNSRYVTHLFRESDPDVSIELLYRQGSSARTTYRDLKGLVRNALFNEMMQNRLKDLYPMGRDQIFQTVRFVSADRIGDDMSFNVNNLSGVLRCTSAKSVEPGIKLLLKESERIRRYGFSQRELDSARSTLTVPAGPAAPLDMIEAARMYEKNFVAGDVVPAVALDSLLRVRFLQVITLEEINQVARGLVRDKNWDIGLIAPERFRSALPDEERVLSWWNEIHHTPIKKYEEEDKKPVVVQQVVVKTVFPAVDFGAHYQVPAAVAYTKKEFKEIGVTEVRLANGLRVVIKPAVSASTDLVFLHGERQFGYASYMGDRYYAARMAASITSTAGVGELDKEALEDYLEKKKMSISFEIEGHKTYLKGKAPGQEQEALLQLAYRYFLHPRKDTGYFNTQLDMWKQKALSADILISDELSKTLGYAASLRMRDWPFSPEEYDKIRYEDCLSAYEDCFSVPQDFTFVITGVHDVEKTIALAARYLGNLPVARTVAGNDHPSAFLGLNQIIDRRIPSKLLHDHSRDCLLFVGRCNSEREKIKLEMLGRVIELALKRRIRETEGGTYYANAGARVWKESSIAPESVYEIRASFECSPELSRKLLDAALDELELIRQKGPNPVEFGAIMKQIKKYGFSRPDKDDYWWAGALTSQYANTNEFSLAGIFGTESLISSISARDIQQAAQDYLPRNAYVSVIETSEKP